MIREQATWVVMNHRSKSITLAVRAVLFGGVALTMSASCFGDSSNPCGLEKDRKLVVQGCTQVLAMTPPAGAALVSSLPAGAAAETRASADPAKDCQQNDDLELKVQGCTQFMNTSPPAAQRATALLYRGWAYARLGQYGQAIADLTASIEIRADASSYAVRGWTYKVMQRCDLAIADLNQAIHLQPDFFDAYQNRGTCRLAAGNTEDAISDFNVLIQKKPELPLGYFLCAWANEVAERNDAAIADLTNVMNLDANWKALALFYRGLANESKGRNDLAESDFSSAITLSSAFAMERNWVEYLKSIQVEDDYANWSGKPYNLYLRLSGL